MKEPVYECTRCGETIEKSMQGKVIWCERCRQIWEEGFWQGVMSHDRIMSRMNVSDIIGAMRDAGMCPYVGRE